MPEIIKAFGWLKQQPDARDYIYNAPRGVLQSLPPVFRLDKPSPGWPFDPAFDQGQLGSCGPNAECKLIAYDDLQQPVRSYVYPSRMFTYYTTRTLMGTVNYDSGVDNRTMLKALAQFGWCDASYCPYTGHEQQFTQTPSHNAYAQALTRAGKIIYQAVPQSLDQMKGCLYDTRKPFIFGWTVYDSALTTEVDKTGDVPMPSQSEKVRGGHDWLITGWNDLIQRFYVANSWSYLWGILGYGTIPYAYGLNPNLSGDFWTVLRTGA